FLQLCEHYSYTITRTWLATDPSGNTAKKVQLIHIMDNKAPDWAFLPPPFLTVECSEANNNKADPIPVDACDESPSILLDIKYQFGIYNCVNNYLATYTWTAGDKCGNTLKYVQQIAVVDTTAPEIYCPSNIVVTSQVPTIVTWLEPFVNDNCGVPPVTVEILGPPSGSLFQPNTVTTIMYQTTDNCGNTRTCSFTVTVNSQGGGGGNKVKLNGTLINKKSIPVENVEVSLSGSLTTSLMASGQYSFINLVKGSNLTVTPVKKDNPLNGVNTLDLIYITNHILGKKVLDSPYKILAADVNNSKNITTGDVVKVKKLILHIIDKFDNVDSWTFLPASLIFQNPINPWLTPITNCISVNNIQTDQSANFTAIKMGDVTWDATGKATGKIDTKGLTTFSLLAKDKSFQKNEEVVLELSSKNLADLKAMQFTLEFNTDKLEFVSIESDRKDINEEDFGLKFLDAGKITGSIVLKEDEEQKLCKLIFKAKEIGTLLNSISLTSNLTNAEAYTKDEEAKALNLLFTNETEEGDGLSTAVLYQNEPNPFENTTVIRFFVPENQEANLRVYSLEGKVIKEIKEVFSKGEHQVRIGKEAFISSGIYYYQLKTDNFIDTKKMMFVN
ncbi:MAG TPA: HYR domain-containing protein, partial [Saprospiraceae bacterium]|nr:HYR domain-containing protein [Saprospiraceae bacterium]